MLDGFHALGGVRAATIAAMAVLACGDHGGSTESGGESSTGSDGSFAHEVFWEAGDSVTVPDNLAVAGGTLVWTTPASLYHAELTDSAPPAATPLADARSVATDGATAFVSVTTSPFRVAAVDLASDAVTTLAPDLVVPRLVLADGTLYVSTAAEIGTVSTADGSYTSLVADADRAFAVGDAIFFGRGMELEVAPLSGGTYQPRAALDLKISGVMADGPTAYVRVVGAVGTGITLPHKVLRIDAGGAATELWSGDSAPDRPFASDDEALYVVTSDGYGFICPDPGDQNPTKDSIHRIPKDGSPPTLLAGDIAFAVSLASDGQDLYVAVAKVTPCEDTRPGIVRLPVDDPA